MLLLPLLLTACASSGESSDQRGRLADVASKTVDQVRASGGVSIAGDESSGLVVSPDSRFVKISDAGIVVDVKDGGLLLSKDAVRSVLKKHPSSAASPDLIADLPFGSYLKITPDAPVMTESISQRASVVLPMLKLLSGKRCIKQVEVSAVDKTEIFRVLFDPDCAMDVLDMSTPDFLSSVSEDFTLTAVSGVVSSFGPTGSSAVSITGFERAVDPSWDGSFVTAEDLLRKQSSKR